MLFPTGNSNIASVVLDMFMLPGDHGIGGVQEYNQVKTSIKYNTISSC